MRVCSRSSYISLVLNYKSGNLLVGKVGHGKVFSDKLKIMSSRRFESGSRGGSLRRPSVLAWLRLLRVMQKVERDLAKQLRLWGLNNAQFDVLAHVGAAEGITQQELAARLLVTKGNICGMIDRMEAGGWVERRPDPEDRRVNRLFLTGPGKCLRAEAVPAHHALIVDLMKGLGGTELQALHQLLEQLEDGMGNESGIGG